ncbi:MAG: glycosyltransferase family 4 protein [Bacteroidetes bacterium]|nr:glycosyltransferase family 4 protein [Bacteroidota bacterium]
MGRRLAIVTTHPIQYNAPWFRLLAESGEVTLRVFYTWEQSQTNEKYDPGFGKVISWDIPLLDGYDYKFVKNVSVDPGSHHFKGIYNPTLISEIKEWKADCVLVIGWPFKSHLACMRYFKGKIPVLFRGDSTLLEERAGIKKLLRTPVLKYIYSFVDYAMYVGENNKQYFLAHGIKENELWYVPHAIDNKRFAGEGDNYDTEAARWRQELGIGKDKVVILYAGKLEPSKNVQLLLQMADILSDDRYRFVIVGNGETEAILKEQAKGDERILFLGFQNQNRMPVVYRLGDVFILPSNGPETWGLGINEAMASGRAVIATTKCGGSIDLIKDNGTIISPGDTMGAVDYIRKVTASEDGLRKAGARSKQIIADFSFEHICNNILTLLKIIPSGKA